MDQEITFRVQHSGKHIDDEQLPELQRAMEHAFIKTTGMTLVESSTIKAEAIHRYP